MRTGFIVKLVIALLFFVALMPRACAQVMLPARKVVATTPTAAASLTGDLIAYWKLDEASGTRADSDTQGTAMTLSAFGSVGNTTGIINLAAFWNGVEYLFRAGVDSAPLNGGDRDFTIATWVKTTTAAANMAAVSKGGLAAYEYLLFITNNGGLRFSFLMNQSDQAYASTEWSSTVTDGVWYFVVAWFDSANNLMWIQVNDGTPVSASMTLTPITSTTIFFLGVDANSNFMSGAIDETAFWTRLLTSTERTFLYNSGAARTCCPFP